MIHILYKVYKPVTASSFEVDSTAPAKVVDGNMSTHWGTAQNKAANEWVEINLQEAKQVRQINIYFERTDANQNILGYKIELENNGTYTEVYRKAEKAKQVEKILLNENKTASKVKITILDANGGTLNWKNVGINEVEVYSTDQSNIPTLDSVISSITGQTIENNIEKLPMPSVPGGFSIKINGADFEQIIATDGSIVRPLTDKNVKVSFVVTETATNKTKKTDDLNFIIKGKNTQKEGMNTKPVVIPEIAEWYSDSSNTLNINTINKVVYNDDSLVNVVDEFIDDYKNFTGVELSKEKGSTKSNSYNFIKEAPDTLLGDEGYTMDIQGDKIVVKSQSVTGNMYGMQTILQMYKQNKSTFNVGIMRDYPRFKTRGFLFDVARKPVSMEMMKDVARTMRYYKMNDFQVHLSDNYIFLEDYGKLENEKEAFKAYEAFRLESGLKNDKGESPTAKDYYMSKEEFNDFIVEERNLGMNIVPEIDVPAHATSFTKIWPELMVANQVSRLNSNRPLLDHIDISKPEAINKVKEIFDDYTKGSNPTFDSQTTVHIGADEFLANYTSYRNFINELVPYIKESNTVRMWGGLTWIDDGKTVINKEAIENVEMNLWSSGWADGIQMYDMGYKLINTIDDFGYMVPNGNKTRSNSYGDLLNVNRIFNEFEANRIGTRSGYKYIPSGDNQVLGAAFAIWNDNIDKRASGLTESDLYWRFFDAMPFYAEKTWATTGKEKGTSQVLSTLASEKGIGPRINPYYQESKVGSVYQSYDFENGLQDTSPNDRDLVQGKAKVENGALVLSEKDSYVTSTIEKLGNGNKLSFDITLNKSSKPGDILFEADSPYGTHDIRIMENGKLGFTRELYNYYFDYELPVGKKVNIKIVAKQQKTELYVNDEFVSQASGKFIHNDIIKKENITNSTFALPLERIGSKTNAIQGVIDNVEVSETKAFEDVYHKENWNGTTNTETIYNDTEGKLIYAFDNKANTIWHSNWQGASDKLNGSNSFYAEINLGKSYEINQFSFTPRSDAISGYVTKADLYIKNKASDEWKLVAENKVFDVNANKKTFIFDEQEVQYIKFVAKASNDGWVAVSEFDIANKPEQMFTVYVDTTDGGSVSGGKDVRKGEEVTVTATPNKGYSFDGWYNSLGNKVSESVTYTFNVASNTSLTAKFIKVGVPEANKSELQNLYNENKDRLEEIYTSESWVSFKAELDNSMVVLENKEATQEVVDEALNKLTNVIDKLQIMKGDKTELKKIVETIKVLDESKYIASTWSNLTAELEKAKKVIENEDAVESEVNDAYNKLVKVYLELRLIVDKTKLQELINEAEAIDVSKYTEVSIAILNEKVQELKSILNDKEATQEVVNEASKALEKVLDNLELVKADDNETTSTPGDTETKPATPKPTVPPTSNAIDLANSTITIAGNNKVKEDKASKLPNTGGTSAIGVILSALMITGAGVFLRRKK